jgi:17beta-estradiol 17-dehydrogenase / very-long-chain 3-oxoacyl-CoA reductase
MLTIENILFLLGLNYLLSAFFTLARIATALLANKDVVAYGNNSWALITACTDGIGKGFAQTLAKKSFNIVQVGRNPEKLASCASDLKSKYGVEVRNIVKDFSLSAQNPKPFFEDIFYKTTDLDISIIVNNVGTNARHILHQTPEKSLLEVLSMNLFPVVFLTRLYLPQLQQRKLGGAIVNLSSLRSNGPSRRFVSYSATKVFDLVISNVVATDEMVLPHKAKVDVLGLQPGYVDSPLTKELKFRPLMITPEECAEAALKCLGKLNYTAGHWKHLLMVNITAHLLKFG